MPRSNSFPPLQRPAFHSQGGETYENSTSNSSSGPPLVYLDIDGVLNTTAQRAARQHLADDLIASLRSILAAVPEAGIVLSSSWRLQPPLMEALEARLAAEGVPAPIGVTGEAPLPERDPAARGECNIIDAELTRLAAQRSAEINASVSARRPPAWIAIDDLDLRQPAQSSLRKMGYPPRQPPQVQNERGYGRSADRSELKGNSGLPPLAVRQPFSQAERRACLPQHPLAARLPRRRLSRGPANSQARPEAWICSERFVHTSEAAGLTSERAQFAIGLLQVQLSNSKCSTRTLGKERAYSH